MRGEELGVDALPGRLPGDRLGAVLAELGVAAILAAGSPQAQLGQSNPSSWFTRSSVRADRAVPISDSAYRIDTATPGTPTAEVSGSPILSFSSSATDTSSIFVLQRYLMIHLFSGNAGC